MKEKPLTFSRQPSLTGVITEPAVRPNPLLPTCVLLNAGLVHRVGPNRLYVQLARHLAQKGYRAFRFDLSGRGDSEVRRDGMPFDRSAPIEAKAAMDHLHEATGTKRFVLVGICSGAIYSLQTALMDSRVCGLVAIDAPAYPTAGYHVRYYLRRLFKWDSWRNTLVGRNEIGRRLWSMAPRGKRRKNDREDLGDPFEDQLPRIPRAEASEILLKILGFENRALFIYSGSWSSYNYRDQFSDAFPEVVRTGRLQVEYFADADHTFSAVCNQERLIDTVSHWLESNWRVHTSDPLVRSA